MKRFGLFACICFLFYSTVNLAASQSIEVTPCEFNEAMAIGLSPPDFFSIYHRTGQMPIRAVTTPNFQSGFEAEIGFWRARPNDSELAYTILDPTPILTPDGDPLLNSTNSRLMELDPSHPLSFFASARYIFGNTHRDLKLSYYQVDEETKEHLEAPEDGALWAILSATPVRAGQSGGPHLTATEVNAKNSYNFNIASLDLGHHIYSLRVVDFRVFAGLGYASISRDMDVTYHNVDQNPVILVVPTPVRVVITQDSTFKGIGPRIGASGTVEFGSGFGLVAQIANEVLIGGANSKYLDEVFDAEDTLVDATTINPNSQDRIVPVIDGKLALRYNLALNPSFNVGIEAGYQIFHFFNPFTTFRYGSDPAGVEFSGATHTKTVHDANLEGAYLALNFSGFSTCGNVCPPFPVTVPYLPGGFEFGFGIDYLKPYYDQFDYAILDGGPIPRDPILIHPSLNSVLKEVEPDYDEGFHAHIGYEFSFSPYDITLDYLNLNASKNARLEAAPTGGIWPITSILANEFDFIEAPSVANIADARVSASERVGSLVLGKHVYADTLKMRLFGGVEAAEVRNQLKTTYNIPATFGGTPLINPTEVVTQTSKYTGVGPRIGFDADYFFSPNFALVSHFGSAFLYGKLNSSITDVGPDVPILGEDALLSPRLGTSSSETSHIVPTLDASLGLAFNTCFFTLSHASFEVGYKFNHYFNAAESFRHVNPISGTFLRQVNDITFAGPYVDLTFYGISFCPPVCQLPTPSVATVPEFFGGIEFGIKYLYFNPHAGNFAYAIVDPSPTPAPSLGIYPFEFLVSSNSHVEAIDPEFDSGYGLHLGYEIACTANDISVNYEYFTADDSDRVQATPAGVIWPQLTFVVEPFSGGLPPTSPSFPVAAREANARVAFRYNYANLEIGRHHTLRCVDLRLAMGLGYTNLSEDLHVIYLDGITQNTADLGVPQTDVFIDTTFTGIGPRFAATAKYVSPYVIGFKGTASTDLLIGKLKSEYVASTSDGLATTLDPNGHVYVVPKLGLDLAVTFDYTLACYHRISLDIGYEINHFFNATNSYQYTSGMLPAHVKGERDVSFDGPYVQLQVLI